jgi:hypothetical protein
MNNHQASVEDVNALLKAELKRVGPMLLAPLRRQLSDANFAATVIDKVFDDVSFVVVANVVFFVGPISARPS